MKKQNKYKDEKWRDIIYRKWKLKIESITDSYRKDFKVQIWWLLLVLFFYVEIK